MARRRRYLDAMTTHRATLSWTRGTSVFTDNRYSRAHVWRFDGGATVPASSSPDVVPVPLSDATAVDPEEAFVASLSSCHMLWFLSIAARRGLVVESYDDEPEGHVTKTGDGRAAMTSVVLRPRVVFAPPRAPSSEEQDALHHEAHRQCFLANAVSCELRIEPAAVS